MCKCVCVDGYVKSTSRQLFDIMRLLNCIIAVPSVLKHLPAKVEKHSNALLVVVVNFSRKEHKKKKTERKIHIHKWSQVRLAGGFCFITWTVVWLQLLCCGCHETRVQQKVNWVRLGQKWLRKCVTLSTCWHLNCAEIMIDITDSFASSCVLFHSNRKCFSSCM